MNNRKKHTEWQNNIEKLQKNKKHSKELKVFLTEKRSARDEPWCNK